jgi:hypothetical protein
VTHGMHETASSLPECRRGMRISCAE